MSPSLLSPIEAATLLSKRLAASWAERICAELNGASQEPIECALRPGVTGSAAVEKVGFKAWTNWRIAWAALHLDQLPGVAVELREIRVAGVVSQQPYRLRVNDLLAGIAVLKVLGKDHKSLDIERPRRIGEQLRLAGITVTASRLKSVSRLSDEDVQVVLEAVAWLQQQPDLGQWTTRQLPVPGMHTKWLRQHLKLLTELTGRQLENETRPRLSVVHLSYVDPDYRALGGRRHDAWTTGDNHKIAYRPRTVLVVENRDCRLWFPEFPETIVVEGGGKAAAALISQIDWLIEAEQVVYWGDIDSDGFAILDNLRAELAPRGVKLKSILMDETARLRYAQLGVNVDRHGVKLQPTSTPLGQLSAAEAQCYANIATLGEVSFRRIEQERIDLVAAVQALRDLVKQ